MSSSDSDEGSSPDLNCALCPLNITRSEFIPHRVHPSLGVGLCQDCYDDVVTPRAALSDDEEGEEGEAAEVDEDGFESRCCCCGDDGSLLCCESGGPAPDAAGSTLASAVLPQDSLAGAASESPSSSTATPGAGGGEGGGARRTPPQAPPRAPPLLLPRAPPLLLPRTGVAGSVAKSAWRCGWGRTPCVGCSTSHRTFHSTAWCASAPP